MKQKIFVAIVIVIIIGVGLFCFFTKNNYKTVKFGNTSIKSAEDIKEYILNLTHYEAEIKVEVHSNKTQNQYKIKQNYQAPNLANQEIIEPVALEGLKTTYDGTNLKIENTKLNLSKLYENYPYVAENNLWLSSFIENYKKDDKAILKEEENEIKMQLTTKNESGKNNTVQTLYIDKNTLKPTKLTIEDMNQKMLVYILYKEITINSSR